MAKQGTSKRAAGDVFALPENKRNFELLYKFLSQSQRGMALCRVFPEERLKIFGFFNRDELRKYVRFIDLASPLCTPLEMQKTIIRLDEEESHEKEIFFIYNMESCIYLLNITREEFFQRLNLIRDFFMGFNAIFVFFVTESSLKTMIREAFDFYDWISFTFSFERESREIGPELREVVRDKDVKYSNLDEKIDYLKQSLEKITDEKEKSIRLFELSALYRYAGDYDTALERALDALHIEEKTDDKDRLSAIFTRIGLILHDKGDLDGAEEFYRKALAVNEKSNTLKNAAAGYHNIGSIYKDRGNHDKALEFMFKALEIDIKTNNKVGMSFTYNHIGQVYHKKADLDKALQFLRKGLSITEEINDLEKTAWYYNNIGLIYKDKGQLDEALEFLTKALKIMEKRNDPVRMSACFNNIGLIYQYKGELDTALEYLFKSLRIDEKNNDLMSMRLGYSNIAHIYRLKGDAKKAAEYFRLAEETGKRIKGHSG